MRKVHKNALFLAITSSEYSLEDFILEESKRQLSIKYIPAQDRFSYFIVFNENDFDTFYPCANSYSPKFSIVDRAFPYAGMDFIVSDFFIWLESDVKKYIADKNEIDLWEEYLKGSNLLNFNQENLNESLEFTKLERTQVTLALNDLRRLVPQEFKLLPEQIAGLNERIDYLIEAVDRLNKTDWKGILIGQFLSLITTLALNPEQATLLHNLFIKVLHIIPLLNP